MATVCPTPIHVCRARITRLADTGLIAAAPNNHVVTDAIVTIGVTPEITEGEDIEVKGGCDCVCVSYKGRDRLKRFTLAMQLCRLEPALIEMLTGASLFSNGSSEPIGNTWPTQAAGCSTPGGQATAVELWSDNWSGDAQAAAPNQYTRWVFPRVYWQWDEFTLANEFMLPQFNGWTQSNTAFPGNPYGDNPAGVSSIVGASGQGGYFFDDGPLPTAVCGYSASST